MSISLFLVADNQEVNLGDTSLKYNYGVTLPYEDELVSCVGNWRKYGGDFSDIPIYVHCPTRRGVSDTTISIIENMGAIYIHEYMEETDGYVCGYLNVPLSGKRIESIVDSDIILHIDLDMRLIKKPDKDLFSLSDNMMAKIGINEWRPTDRYNIKPIYPFEANTGFIVSRKGGGFYRQWYDRLWKYLSGIPHDDPAYSIYEERIIDIMYFEESYPFEFVDKFQINGDVSSWSDTEVKNVSFFHGHLNMVERNKKYWELYLRRYAKTVKQSK